MKSAKSVFKSAANGEWSDLGKAASERLAKSKMAMKQRLAGVGDEAGVATAMANVRKRLVALQANANEYVTAMKHQASRAQKNGKTLKELEAPMVKMSLAWKADNV